ncbi:hypothetical protein RFI_00656 [Reticulomyxa filosa]|uniref:Uncharacterized protein n=1 Tax=Reticulomyxa filosa TaxID=46433 RepID=X6PDY9_RETFI|nr:hypothetical protein RFI_00656 [Reticulomyxa filosa]|eukprot:ETO36406.1 hypothetical protein RFI_00656 [Reticulomyxa filosa]
MYVYMYIQCTYTVVNNLERNCDLDNGPRFTISDDEEEDDEIVNVSEKKKNVDQPAPKEEEFTPIEDARVVTIESSSVPQPANGNSAKARLLSNYFPLLAGGYFENLSLEENVLDDSLLKLMVVYMNSKLFLVLFFAALNAFLLFFAFDILFPTFSAIPNTDGGMGWTPTYVGLFYTFYGTTSVLIMWHRWYRLQMGDDWTNHFYNPPARALKIAFAVVGCIYGVIIPWGINSSHIHHAKRSPSSWIFLGIVLAITMGFLSTVVPYHIIQLFRDFSSSSHAQNVETPQQLANLESKLTIQILLSTFIAYLRICAPIAVQWMFILGWDLNAHKLSESHNTKRDWYRIGNFVFYTLACLSAAGFAMVHFYEKWRREELGTEDTLHTGADAETQHDHDAFGFWMASSMKNCVGKQTKHPVCRITQVCMKDNFETWRTRQGDQVSYSSV